MSAVCQRYLFSDCSREPAPPNPEKENAAPAIPESDVYSKAPLNGHKKEYVDEKLKVIKITNVNQFTDNEESLSTAGSKGIAEGYALEASNSDAGPIYRKLYDLTNDLTGQERSRKETLVCSLASTNSYCITGHKFTQRVFNIRVPRIQNTLGYKAYRRSDQQLRDLLVSKVADLERDYFFNLLLKNCNQVDSKKIKLFEKTVTSALPLREEAR